NAYCQDNEASWLNWEWSPEQRDLFDFTRRLTGIRRAHPALRRSRFFQGRPIHGTDLQDLAWFRADGEKMSENDWQNPQTQSLAMFLAGRGIDDLDEQGRPLVDDNMLLVLNASHLDLPFRLPALESVKDDWQVLVDTIRPTHPGAEQRVPAGGTVQMTARSLLLLRSPSRVIRTGGAVHTLGATYRVQLTEQFGFAAARAQLEYLHRLGVTDLYTSPVLAAGKGSTHGYDVVDHGRLNPELGTEEDFHALTDALKSQGMGLLVDWVPNHMGIAPGQNPLWEDVLENGPSSRFADMFDIDWSSPRRDMDDTVLVAILGDQYGRVLERGELQIVNEKGWFALAYYDNRFPLGPRTLVPLVREVARRTGLPAGDPAQEELESICTALSYLPTRDQREEPARLERAREKEVIKRRWRKLLDSSAEVRNATEAALRDVNGSPGAPTTFETLDRVIRNQGYRLASWKVAAEEINYRRFFDINTLAAIKMENPAVFDQAHALLFRFIDEGRIQALRLDHTDGLYDPLAYFDRLQRRFRRDVTDARNNPDDAIRPLPILVEKILEPGERLPTSWPVDGTTGYDFAGSVVGLWVDPGAEEQFTSMHRRFTGDRLTFEDHVYECKQRILQESLPSEVNMLSRQLERVAAADRRWQDFTLIALTRVVRETLAAFPVYRTYVRAGEPASETDVRRIRGAIAAARRRTPMLDASVTSFLQDALLLNVDGAENLRADLTYVALRFQQLTGPVMAKAVEDTAFYRYNRLLALNEVGGDPGTFGTTVDQFHAQNAERAQSWPLSMVTTSTHDTKRGEDAAARIAVLTEMPTAWSQSVTRWSRRAEPYRDRAAKFPSRRDEYTFYQALVGAWPFGWDGRGPQRDALTARLAAYMQKAAREAKEETSWVQPDESYDAALTTFVQGVMHDDLVMGDIGRFSDRLGTYAATNAIAQVLLKLTVPGIPDTYQGCELWNQSLVDPDNRRAVDFQTAAHMLADITQRLQRLQRQDDRQALVSDLLKTWTTGAIKLFVTHLALAARNERKDVFLCGDYTPLTGGSDHVIAFSRNHASGRALVVVPRLSLVLTGGTRPWPIGEVWNGQTLEVTAGAYRDAFTGRVHQLDSTVKVSALLADFPVALLLSVPANEP
ncbi:MAG: malto-oligosyltrehalose synthase, partial [Polyangia bacterium]